MTDIEKLEKRIEDELYYYTDINGKRCKFSSQHLVGTEASFNRGQLEIIKLWKADREKIIKMIEDKIKTIETERSNHIQCFKDLDNDDGKNEDEMADIDDLITEETAQMEILDELKTEVMK